MLEREVKNKPEKKTVKPKWIREYLKTKRRINNLNQKIDDSTKKDVSRLEFTI